MGAAILMLVMTLADGTKQVADVALTPSRDVCDMLAAELNQSPRKPANVQAACRAYTPETRS